MKKLFVLSVLMSISSFIYAASVTIYNDNFALIRDTKEVNLKAGTQTIEIDDVSAKIDPTSVLPKFLSDSDKIIILEHRFYSNRIKLKICEFNIFTFNQIYHFSINRSTQRIYTRINNSISPDKSSNLC